MAHKHQRILLVGSMGAGKTTIGRLLAEYLRLDFFDTDEEIEARCGADISWIFDREGEQGFRDRETQVLKDLLDKERCVIATGGGIILREENRKLLKRNGYVIYLQISVKKQLQRMAHDSKRPLLQTPNKTKVLNTLSQQRSPLYAEVADLCVDVDQDEPRELISNIVQSARENLVE